MVLFAVPSMTMSFLGIGVLAGTVAAFNLFNACTIRHRSVALRTQKIGELYGKVAPSRGPKINDRQKSCRSQVLVHGSVTTAS